MVISDQGNDGGLACPRGGTGSYTRPSGHRRGRSRRPFAPPRSCTHAPAGWHRSGARTLRTWLSLRARRRSTCAMAPSTRLHGLPGAPDPDSAYRFAARLQAASGPLGGRNEIGLRIGIAPTVPNPDIARPQGTAEVPQGAQLIIPATDGLVLLPDVGPPRLGDEPMGASRGISRRVGADRAWDDLDGLQHGVIRTVGMEGEGLEQGRRKLADGAIPCAKEIDRLVLTLSNQSSRFFYGGPEGGFGDPRKTDCRTAASSIVVSRSTWPSVRNIRSFSFVSAPWSGQLLQLPAGGAMVLP